MRAIIFLMVATLLSACSTTSPEVAMQQDVDQATAIIQRFQEIPEKGIPPAVLKAARGVAILTVTKAGFIGSGRGGTGGLGAGFQAGVEITEFVMILNTPAAVEAFSKQANVTLGGNLSVAAGPVGRSAEASVALQSAIYSYSRTQGFFAGVSLEGTAISVKDDYNQAYYGRAVTAQEILSGKVQPPAGARNLLSVLSKY